MARPRKASDEDVFGAAYRVMQRVGPRDFTLAGIATEAGVTAGALVQRFGSKKKLLLKLAQGAADSGPAFIKELRKQHDSPLAVLHAYAACLADLASSPDAYVRNLAYLLEDLSDPGLREQLARQSRSNRTQLAAVIQDAIDCGELAASVKPVEFARIIEALLGGSMMSWAFYRSGSASAWMRKDLDALIEPHLRKKSR